jgi:hypothetical protein
VSSTFRVPSSKTNDAVLFALVASSAKNDQVVTVGAWKVTLMIVIDVEDRAEYSRRIAKIGGSTI